MMPETVISIDPAPSKKSTVCDGRTFYKETAVCLRERLSTLSAAGHDTLVCWDAPLTGPQNPEQAGIPRKDFSQRCIDSFFARKETNFKTPKGISVLPYSGCPHWAITRSLLGLPRTGPWDKSYGELPFHLLPCTDEQEHQRPSVVEIHPAVAAWLWCRGKRGFPKGTKKRPDPWLYKKKACLRKQMWDAIRDETRGVDCEEPKGDDDDFDAAVGYLLGMLYLRDRHQPKSDRTVVLLGDRETGSFLVPRVDGLLESWKAFVEKWRKAQNC